MKKIIPYVLMLSGIILMCYGIYIDELNIIMQKSIRICLECIGIG